MEIARQVLRAICCLQVVQSLLLIQISKNIYHLFVVFFFFKLKYDHEVKFRLPDSRAARFPLLQE